MSIQKQDILSQEAIDAPLVLSKNMMEAVNSAYKLMEVTKSFNAAANGDSPSKHKKAIEDLTLAQMELEKIQKQVATAEARNTQAYQDQIKVLQKVKEETRQKSVLGDKDAKSVKAQTSSLHELEAALKANRNAYRQLRSDQERNSDSGRELLKVIEEQDQAVKDLKASMGQHQDKVGQYENATKELKLELRAAKDEMAGIAATLGTGSPEFIAAAQRAGKLKDELNDINDAVKNTQASGVENIAGSFQQLGSQLRAGDLSGAATSANQLAASLKGMSSKEIIEGLGGIGKSFKAIGVALFSNPIFLVAGVLVAAAAAFKWFSDIADEVSQKAIERYAKERTTMEERYDLEIRLLQIRGEATFDLERKKQEEIIKSVDRQREAGVAEVNKAKTLALWLLGNKAVYFKENRKLTEDEEAELLKIRQDASKELLLIDAEEQATRTKNAKELTAKLKAELEQRIQNEMDADLQRAQMLNEQDKKRQEEFDAMLVRLQELKTWEEQVQEVINGYGEETTEKFMSQSERRKKQFMDETMYMTSLTNELVATMQGALQSNDNFIKALSKGALVFLLNQVEKELLAVQHATIAKATAQALSTPDSVLTFGATGIARALAISGLIKIAFATARSQIMKFEKGTDFAPGGLAIVGEKGPELIQTPSGRFSLSPNGPSLTYLEKGSKVFTADETKALALSGIGVEQRMNSEQLGMLTMAKVMREENKKLIAAYKSSQPSLVRQGSLLYEVREDEHRNRKLIRRSVMGK